MYGTESRVPQVPGAGHLPLARQGSLVVRPADIDTTLIFLYAPGLQIRLS